MSIWSDHLGVCGPQSAIYQPPVPSPTASSLLVVHLQVFPPSRSVRIGVRELPRQEDTPSYPGIYSGSTSSGSNKRSYSRAPIMLLVAASTLALPSYSMAYSMSTWRCLSAPRGGTTGRNYYCMSASSAGGDGVATRTTDKKIKDLTLVFCRRKTNAAASGTNGNEILLGLKKRGFGEGKWNGFGGKLESGETVEEAAKRELLEESGVTARELSLRGQLIFHVPSYPSIMRVHVYEAVSYEGEPTESEEMRPRWFQEESLPLKDMWADDEFWMPLFLGGKFFRGEFDFSDEQTIVDYQLKDLPSAQAILQAA